ncbi:MAG: diadenylate cyclase CdaA [Clostridiales bacterium]|nr:diadenylate cyclase CdaA [Clostridiales bacterium]
MILGGMEAFFDYAIRFIKVMRISDCIDIFIVTIAVYYCFIAMRGTRAMQLLRGIAIAAVVFAISNFLRLDTLSYILGKVFQGAMVAIIVIFQPELRNLLEHVGRLKLGHFLGLAFDSSDEVETGQVIEDIASAAEDLSKTRTGALIVIERGTRLGEYMHSGTSLDANVTTELLKNIFVPNTPLHDGAVIIRGNKIITAGCVLPLTANTNLSSELGTRHRAALGLSETSDAIIVVVSEETGKISIAINGSLMRNMTRQSLERALTKLLNKEQQSIAPAKRLWLRKSK